MPFEGSPPHFFLTLTLHICSLIQVEVVVSTLPSSNLISETKKSTITPGDFSHRQGGPSTKREIVTITVTSRDYAALKAAGGPDPAYIATALRYYIGLLRKTDWRPQGVSFGWSRGPVVHFLTAIPKDVADEVRSLPGRFDGHTIEAVRMFLGGESDILEAASQEPGFASHGGDWVSAQLGALRFLVLRLLGHPYFP